MIKIFHKTHIYIFVKIKWFTFHTAIFLTAYNHGDCLATTEGLPALHVNQS